MKKRTIFKNTSKVQYLQIKAYARRSYLIFVYILLQQAKGLHACARNLTASMST